MLLSKGFEVEIYTGTPDGQIVGLSDRIAANLAGFVREPDSRNVEYTTAPICGYDRLLCELIVPRQRLRRYLSRLGRYTLIPGSTLSLGQSDRFFRSDPGNPYHDYIEQTYGTRVVTASVHINVGIDDPELLMRACRLVRVEAPLLLALSASSPFLDGRATGHHSTRWSLFPQTPTDVPLFESHDHFITWTEAQLAAGTMQSVRHLWSSVRPNGDRRPYNLNRVELRICDLVTDPIDLLAIAAFLEARLWQLIANPDLDPLIASDLPSSSRAADLQALTQSNEMAAAHHSLDAQLRHWRDGRSLTARDWIGQLYEELLPVAHSKGFGCFLLPIAGILKNGNLAQQWLREHERGASCEAIMVDAIKALARRERELALQICQSLVS
ncbi:MAG: glutamate--cysteine ligase [Cyanobacteria bacterium]|nr:glutamate--cysteine ligase [Cyanobacteriota bacterium]